MILACVGVAGILIIGATAPGLLHLIPRPSHRRRSYTPKAVNQSLRRLFQKGYIVSELTEHGRRLSLTEAGETELLRFEMEREMKKRPQKWDKRWRMIIFDIREKRKPIREQVRRLLVRLGFVRLQDSVWVYPFECTTVMELLRIKFHVRYEVLYVIAQDISNDDRLRKAFSLPEKMRRLF